MSTNLELGSKLAVRETFKRALKDMPTLLESPDLPRKWDMTQYWETSVSSADRSALGDSGSTLMTMKNPVVSQPSTQLSSFPKVTKMTLSFPQKHKDR